MNLFAVVVRVDDDCIIALDRREPRDEVYTHGLPYTFWYTVGVKGSVGVAGSFATLTDIASFHVLPHECGLLWPPEAAADQLKGAVPSWVACGKSVMAEGGDAPTEVFVGRDIQLPVSVDESINHLPLQETVHQLAGAFLLQEMEGFNDVGVLELCVSDFLLKGTCVGESGQEGCKTLWTEDNLLSVVIHVRDLMHGEP